MNTSNKMTCLIVLNAATLIILGGVLLLLALLFTRPTAQTGQAPNVTQTRLAAFGATYYATLEDFLGTGATCEWFGYCDTTMYGIEIMHSFQTREALLALPTATLDPNSAG